MFIVNIKCKVVFKVTVSYVYNIRCSPLFSIRQWGSVQGGNNWDIPYNIAFTNKLFVVLAWDFAAGSNTGMQFVGGNFQQSNRDTFHLYTSNAGGIGLGYIAIGF